MKKILTTLLLLAPLVGQTQAAVIFGGDFAMYKPGTGYTVTATWVSGFSGGVGDGLDLSGVPGVSEVSYSDASPNGVSGDGLGPHIDVPGWAPLQSGNDLTNNGVGGSNGLNIFAAWGGDGRVQTTGSLGTIGGGDITMSVMVGGPSGGPISGPLAFHLLANGVQLTASSIVDPTVFDGNFEMISRTYNAASLAGVTGQDLSIVLGVEDANDLGNRVIFDNVDLSGDVIAVPEPTSALLLSLGGLALMLRRRK